MACLLAVLNGGALAVAPSPAEEANAAVAQVRRDTDWLAGRESRMPGTPGHGQAVRWLREAVGALPPGRVRVWESNFSVLTPVVRRVDGEPWAHLTIRSGEPAGRHRVYPLWPCGVRSNTTPAEGIAGRLVYIGDGAPEKLHPRLLRGQIAVMEMSGGERWREAFALGARAMVLLESNALDFRAAGGHLLPIPVLLPRFYVPEGPLATALRAGTAGEATLTCAADWAEAAATNIYALVLPASGGAPPKDRRALVVAARYDAMSVVPDLAPDADAAVDAATALALLRQLAAHPPRRPVLVAFLDAYGINQLGMRQMLADVTLSSEAARARLAEDRRRVERDYLAPANLAGELGPADAGDDRAIDRLNQDRYEPLRSYVKDEIDRDVIGLDAALQPLRLQLYADIPAEAKDALRRRIAELDAQRQARLAVLRQMTETRPKRGGQEEPIPESYRAPAAETWQRARRRIVGQLEEARGRLAQWDRRDRLQRELRAALGLAPEGRIVSFLMGIDLSDAGPAVGILGFCDYLYNKEGGNQEDFLRWLRKADQDKTDPLWPADLRRALCLTFLQGLDDSRSDSVGPMACLTSPARSFGVASTDWATINAERVRSDTPIDTADRLDWDRLGPQVRATVLLARRMAEDESFAPAFAPFPKWSRITGAVVDRAAGEPLPRVPMQGYLATLTNRPAGTTTGTISDLGVCPGVRRQQFVRTGIDGLAVFDLWPAFVGFAAGGENRSYLDFLFQAYDLAADGAIVRAVDMGRAGQRTRVDVQLQPASAFPAVDVVPIRAPVFSCQEQTVLGLVDPRFVWPLGGSVLEAPGGGVPPRNNCIFFRGMLSALLETGTRWELLLRAGITQNRMILVNMADPQTVARERLSDLEAMRGFPLGEPLERHPYLQSALDMSRLDDERLARYRAAGIHNQAAESLEARGKELLQQADRAREADDGAALLSLAGLAAADEARAYQAVRDTGNDVVRGAVFLLLLLVPFSLAMERLLVASAVIYRQIAWFMVIFAVMVAVLWSFHPAFRISGQPLMILMAFAVISMSLLVLAVVYTKFETGLEEMRSGRAEASGAATSRWGVLGTAARLGVANMRKRKVRTALTALTVVLITFAMLCFISTSHYVGRQEFDVRGRPAVPGVLLRQPTNRALPRGVLDVLEAARAPAVPRWWWSRHDMSLWRIRVRHEASGRQVALKAALGLAPGEGDLGTLRRDWLPQWERFASRGGCYVSAQTADRLGAKPGDRIAVAGRGLELLGTFDSNDMEASAADMDGRTLIPTDYALMPDEQRNLFNQQDINRMEEEYGTAGGLEMIEGLPAVEGDEMVIVPAALLDGLKNATLRSVAIPAKDDAAARALAQSLAERLAYPVYFSAEGRLRVLAAAPLLPRAPRGLFIPLCIGGLIIFTTMLSAIAERRREIYVYTSLGLAPLHVGALFLAEAVTYGLMGSVFGYVAGQGVATLFSRLGWLGGVTLNYSGTHAVTVMVLVLGVVVLSSLVPAYLGGRLAAPSNRRSWALPQPEGDSLRTVLPFTVTPATAPGVTAFLLEYLDAHREGSIGHFATDELEARAIEAEGRRDLELHATVWLAPFDLGVRQRARIYLRQTPHEDALDVRVEMTRRSGQAGAWLKLNRVFLGDLRRQLLGWRKVKAKRVLEYIESGRKLLA